MTKALITRINKLEARSPSQRPGHDYRHVITWEPDDRIVNHYYRDGIEITRGQYERECKPVPGEPLNVKITELDHDKKYK